MVSYLPALQRNMCFTPLWAHHPPRAVWQANMNSLAIPSWGTWVFSSGGGGGGVIEPRKTGGMGWDGSVSNTCQARSQTVLCVGGPCRRLPHNRLGATQTTTDPARDRHSEVSTYNAYVADLSCSRAVIRLTIAPEILGSILDK